MKSIFYSVIILALSLLVSCNTGNGLISKMEVIKAVGDTNQNLAFAMLDSLKIGVGNANEYAKMKYDLLTLRINDKANIKPTSDILSKEVTAYFVRNGNDAEKQEAFYYNGSVYRDLQDTPRAIENFLKSAEIATSSNACDSLLLRNTYSNLYYLFYMVQDYNNCLIYAKKEFQLSKEIKKITLESIMHVGIAYIHSGNDAQARQSFNYALDFIKGQHDYKPRNLYLLMMYLSNLGETKKATLCYNILESDKHKELGAPEYISLAEYFKATNATDSAIACYEHVLESPDNLSNIYDASKFLYKIYNDRDDGDKALKYARLYIATSDSLDLGKRQERAATVNNQFKYHYDKGKEVKVRESEMKYHYLFLIFLILTILIILSAITIHVYLRNKSLRKTVALTKELDSIKNDRHVLQERINLKTEELEESKRSLSETVSELEKVRERMAEVKGEMFAAEEKLKERENALSEKLEQNQAFIRLLNKTEFEVNADETINAIRQSANGSKKLTASEWRQLYHAVDELYPDFKSLLVQKLGNFTEQQMQLCYLMRIGLTKPQIQNITNIPHVTVWRWTKKFSWASDIDTK